MSSSMLRREFIQQAATVGATAGLALFLGHRPTAGTPDVPDDPGTDPAPAPSADPPKKAEPTEPAEPAMLRFGDSGDAVDALQAWLGRLGYWCGTPDGHYGGLTASAVTAVQKAAGLSRDGICGPATSGQLARGARPKASTTTGHVIEIHRDTQLLLIVDSGRVGTILATCTGSEVPYESEGRTWSARTTPGSYHVYLGKDGWDHGPLGDLYRPMFFNGGIAVHGATSVPPYPASHGCCRLTTAAMDMILARKLITIGTAVVVY